MSPEIKAKKAPPLNEKWGFGLLPILISLPPGR
jgi:hypothetical protein